MLALNPWAAARSYDDILARGAPICWGSFLVRSCGDGTSSYGSEGTEYT